MEDKYFNEFFDKLYNGKLNIYEDEETSDEKPNDECYNFLEDILNHKTFKSFNNNIEIFCNPNLQKQTPPMNSYYKLKNDKGDNYINRNLNGFWEVYGIESNNLSKLVWRKKIRDNTERKECLKSYLENKVKEIYNGCDLEKRLQKLRYDFDKTVEIPKDPKYDESEIREILRKLSFTGSKTLLETIDKTVNVLCENTNYFEFETDFRAEHLNGFWELYDIESNNIERPAWRHYIREDNEKYTPDFKEYLQKFIENNYCDDFYNRLIELKKQKNTIEGSIIPEDPKYDGSELKIILTKLFGEKNSERTKNNFFNKIKLIYEKDYSQFTDSEKYDYLNGYWELYDIPSNKINAPVWRKSLRNKNEKYEPNLKEYLQNFIEEIGYNDFYERLIELREQFEESDPEWKKYQESFSKKYNGNQYFVQKIWAKYGRKDETGEFESKIHDLSNANIDIIKTINEYVYQCYITTGTTTQEVKEERICPYNYEPSQIPEFYNWLKDEVVDIVKAHLIKYLNEENTKIKKYDIVCSQDLGDIIKSGYKLEVKKMRELDGRFANYITSGLYSKNIPSKFGKAIYKEFILMLLGKNEDLKKDSKEIYNKIINDNCKHFDGMLIGDDGDENIEGFTLYVPKEYITLYISTTKWDITAFTLRYHINIDDLKNCYRIIKPKNSKGDLTIRLLNDDDINIVKTWRMDMVDKIYEKGKCPQGQSVDESYDSYLDQLVENFFNTGKFFS